MMVTNSRKKMLQHKKVLAGIELEPIVVSSTVVVTFAHNEQDEVP